MAIEIISKKYKRRKREYNSIVFDHKMMLKLDF